MREVESAGVFKVVADDALVGRLNSAEGFLGGGGRTAWLEGHFHRIEFIIRKPAIILSSHLYIPYQNRRQVRWADVGAKRHVYQSVGKEGEELRIDGGVEHQQTALLSALLRMARSQSSLLVAHLHLDGELLVVVTLLALLHLYLPSALSHTLRSLWPLRKHHFCL